MSPTFPDIAIYTAAYECGHMQWDRNLASFDSPYSRGYITFAINTLYAWHSSAYLYKARGDCPRCEHGT